MINKFTTISLILLSLNINFLEAQCFKKISTVWDTNIALSDDGTIWEWGSNNNGQLGIGTNNFQHKNIPFQLTTSNDWKDVISYYTTTMAQKNDGTLWAWGQGSNGIFGNGTSGISNYIFVPTQVVPTPFEKVFQGYAAGFAIKSNGTLWGWGENSDGQVGVGSSPFNVVVPTQLGSDTNWKFTSGGLYHTISLKTDGTLWGWGANCGTLGNGTTQSTSLPIQIGTENTWKEISTSVTGHTLALKTNGTLWAWGGNEFGQVGDGTTTLKTIPTQIGTDNDWKLVKTSSSSSFAIKNDGSLWAWGRNEGIFGDGTTLKKLIPTRIGNSYDWSNIECGGLHCVARKLDNSVWTWGYNNRGQLGNGTFTNNFLPTMIKGPCTVLSTTDLNRSGDDLILFPNPVSQYINFSKNINTIKIYNLNGLLIREFYKVNDNRIDLLSMDIGVYIIDAVATDGTLLRSKIIKK